MKALKYIVSLFFICFFCAQANAQLDSNSDNDNTVVSRMKVVENESGIGELEVQVSGSHALDVTAVKVTIAGKCVPGGSYTVLIDNSKYFNPEPVFNTVFQLLPSIGNSVDKVSISVTLYDKDHFAAGTLPARNKIIARRRRSN